MFAAIQKYMSEGCEVAALLPSAACSPRGARFEGPQPTIECRGSVHTLSYMAVLVALSVRTWQACTHPTSLMASMGCGAGTAPAGGRGAGAEAAAPGHEASRAEGRAVHAAAQAVARQHDALHRQGAPVSMCPAHAPTCTCPSDRSPRERSAPFLALQCAARQAQTAPCSLCACMHAW